MTTTHSTCRSLHSQIGLRARQRLDTVLPSSTFNLFRPPWNPAPSPSAYFRRTFHQTFQARDLSKSEEKLVEIIKRKNEAYEQVLAQQSLPSTDPSTQISLSKQLKLLSPLSSIYKEYLSLSSNLQQSKLLLTDPSSSDLHELAQEEITSIQTSLKHLLNHHLPQVLLPPSDTSSLGAIIELKSAVGGTESSLFLSTILRMYIRYSHLRNFTPTILSHTPVSSSSGVSGGGGGVDGPLKDAVLKIEGKGVFGEMRWERGVHRVQRVPETEGGGRVHTSTIGVVVLPVVEDDGNTTDDLVDEKDVKTEVMRSRGAGGQHVNKTESAVRLTHIPTGISVSMQDSRSQHQNKAWAWQILRARLLAKRMEEEQVERRRKRSVQVGGGGRSEKVRTYNFPQDRLTDHRIGLTITGLDNVLEGDGLEYVIRKLKEHNQGIRMEALLEDGEDIGDDD